MSDLYSAVQTPERAAFIDEDVLQQVRVVQYAVQASPCGIVLFDDAHIKLAEEVDSVYKDELRYKDTLMDALHNFPDFGAKILADTENRLSTQRKAIEWIKEYDQQVASFKEMAPDSVSTFHDATVHALKTSLFLNGGESKTYMEALRASKPQAVDEFTKAELGAANCLTRCGKAILVQALVQTTRPTGPKAENQQSLASLEPHFKNLLEFLLVVASPASVALCVEVASIAHAWCLADEKGWLSIDNIATGSVDKKDVNDLRCLVGRTCESVLAASANEHHQNVRSFFDDVLLPALVAKFEQTIEKPLVELKECTQRALEVARKGVSGQPLSADEGVKEFGEASGLPRSADDLIAACSADIVMVGRVETQRRFFKAVLACCRLVQARTCNFLSAIFCIIYIDLRVRSSSYDVLLMFRW